MFIFGDHEDFADDDAADEDVATIDDDDGDEAGFSLKCENADAVGRNGDEGLGEERGNVPAGRPVAQRSGSRHRVASRNKITTSTTTTTHNRSNTRNMSTAPPHHTRCDRFGYTKSGFALMESS